jgi:hypothetical protein
MATPTLPRLTPRTSSPAEAVAELPANRKVFTGAGLTRLIDEAGAGDHHAKWLLAASIREVTRSYAGDRARTA